MSAIETASRFHKGDGSAIRGMSMNNAQDIGCTGVSVLKLADAQGNRHVVMLFERADGEPPLLLALDADTALAAAGDLINSAMTARGMEPPATAQ